MKNNKFGFFLSMCVISLLCVFMYSNATINVDANTTIPSSTINAETPLDEDDEVLDDDFEDEEEKNTTFEGFQITTNVITDEYLYSALLDLYSEYFESINGQAYSGTTIYSDMFKNFETINLDKKNISSLDGLEKLDLEKLKSFSANSNSISQFKGSYFLNTEDWTFTSLSLADNEIYSANFDGLVGLNNINLSSNRLNNIDFTSIEGRSSGSAITINLANNYIKSFDDIKLPDRRIFHYNINIINNNIIDIPETYFSDKYTLNIGAQGFNSESLITTDTASNLIIFKTNIENLKILVYKVDGEIDELINTISDTEVTGKAVKEVQDNFIRLDLNVGKYKYVYQLNGVDAYSKEYTGKYYQKYCEFNVVPQNLNYVFVHKNKEYSELGKVTGKVTVKLTSNDEGAKIFYQVNNGEWIEGDSIVCGDGGNYSIKVKSVVDGVESIEQNIWVRTSLNLYIPDALMLVLILLLALVLFLVVLPIVSKKYFKKD